MSPIRVSEEHSFERRPDEIQEVTMLKDQKQTEGTVAERLGHMNRSRRQVKYVARFQDALGEVSQINALNLLPWIGIAGIGSRAITGEESRSAGPGDDR